MTALEDTQWTGEKSTDHTREAGVCPVCGQGYTVTRTGLKDDGTEGAFYAHDTGDPLIDLCIEWVDGSTTRRIRGRRSDWLDE